MCAHAIYQARVQNTNLYAGRLFEGKTPASAFLNSNYDVFFYRWLDGAALHPITSGGKNHHYFEAHGFTLNKPTAHKLVERALSLFENLYRCIRQTVLEDSYKAADETYYKILVSEKNSKGKGTRKGYLWIVTGININCLNTSLMLSTNRKLAT